jgi:hypothetical protein
MKKSTSDAPINVKGGEVLTVIYERMQTMSGDPTAVKVYGTLLTAAGVPYVEMLRVWTTTGRLEDPYEELCVKESKFISKGILEVDYTDEYWERRYTVSCVSEKMWGVVYAYVWVASRWLDPLFEAPAYRCSSATYCWRSTTRWRLYTAPFGGLETQVLTCREIS